MSFPTLNFMRPAAEMKIEDAFEKFANPKPVDSPPITLVRPSIIFSAASYSTPIGQPVALGYLAATLQRARYRIQAVDYVAMGMHRVTLADDKRFKIRGVDSSEAIASMDPRTDIFGVSIMFSQEWPHARRCIEEIRKAFPKAKIVVGGEHVTALPEFTLRDCPAIDFVVRGEGELSFLHLCFELRSGRSGEDVPGVCSLKGEKFVDNSLAPRLAEIGKIPWPAWDQFKLEPYFQPHFTTGISHGRNMAMIATRGCPYQCTFCSSPFMWTTRYGMRPAKDVVDEMESYVEKYQVNSIDFYDLTAIIKKSWIIEFAEEIQRRGLKLSWQLPSGTRSEVIDEEVIAAVAKAGLDFLVYAPESGSKRILKLIKKQVQLDKMLVSIRTALRHRIVVKVNFIIGFPEETRRDVWQTLLFVWRLALNKVDDCNISTFSPYPGSEYFNMLRREGTIPHLDDAYFDNLMVQFDVTLAKTFCRAINSVELAGYRILGMSVFYLLSYLRSPGRGLRIAKLLLSRKFQPKSLFEQRLFDFFSRTRLVRPK